MFGLMGATSAADLVQYEERLLSSEFTHIKMSAVLLQVVSIALYKLSSSCPSVYPSV